MSPAFAGKLRPLWVLCLVIPGVTAVAARGEDNPPAVIITDTEAYCDHLQQMIGDRALHVPDARRLFAEGRRMCDHGEVRAGIARLRQALIIVRHRAPVVTRTGP
jgi:hypothetical protein